MTILAIDFSSPQRSVAVWRPDTGAGEAVETGAGFSRGLAMVDAALHDAKIEREQIERIVVGLGPGSYTGIRAAIALAQGWQLARDVKLLGISSAETIAAQAVAEGFTGRVNVVIDAQRGEFYLAAYDLNPASFREIEPLRIVAKAEIFSREQAGEILIGPEVTRWFASGRIIFPRAATLAKYAAGRNDFVTGEKLEPVYLRETTFVKAPPSRVIL
jgi:tRNA threonylcarbamoyladenosine biosynthesis protein TsaB